MSELVLRLAWVEMEQGTQEGVVKRCGQCCLSVHVACACVCCGHNVWCVSLWMSDVGADVMCA